jgi:hypothetical protein
MRALFAFVGVLVAATTAHLQDLILASDCALIDGSPCLVNTAIKCPFINTAAVPEQLGGEELLCPPTQAGDYWCCNQLTRGMIRSFLYDNFFSTFKGTECCARNLVRLMCSAVCSPGSTQYLEQYGQNFTLWIAQATAEQMWTSCKDTCDYTGLGALRPANSTEFIAFIGHWELNILLDIPGVKIDVGTVIARVGYNPQTNATYTSSMLGPCGHDRYGCGCPYGNGTNAPHMSASASVSVSVCQQSPSCCTGDASVSSHIEALNSTVFAAGTPCRSNIEKLLCQCLCAHNDTGALWGTTNSTTRMTDVECFVQSGEAYRFYNSCFCAASFADVKDVTRAVSRWPTKELLVAALSGVFSMRSDSFARLNVSVGRSPASLLSIAYAPFFDSLLANRCITPASSESLWHSSSSNGGGGFNTMGLAIGLGIGGAFLVVAAIAGILGIWLRRRLKKRPMALTDIEMISFSESEEDAIREKGIYLSKSVLCFTPAVTVEVAKECTDTIVLRNHSMKEIRVALLPVPMSHKFTLVSKPDAPTPVPPKGELVLHFAITLHCTTTITLDVPLELGEGGTKARISGVVTSAPSYLLDFDEIKMGAKLGDGASASVFKGTWRGVDVALKCFRLAELDTEAR